MDMVLLVGAAGTAVLTAAVVAASAPSQPSDESSPDSLSSHNPEDKGSPASGGGHLEYVAFVLVPVFFVMGLLGILICHLLKKKGYRCTTEAESSIEEEKIAQEKNELQESLADSNTDTVGHIVDYIMKNEANVDVLNALVADNSMYGDNSVFDPESPATPCTPGSPVSPGTPLSPNATPSRHVCRGHHLHTVGGVVERNACTRCSQKRWHLLRPAQKTRDVRKGRAGAVTVLAVGRFRVTKVEPKSKERKSMVSDSGEGTNGEVPSTPMSARICQRNSTETEA